MGKSVTGSDSEPTILELKPAPLAFPALPIAGACVGVAAVGILAPDLAGDELSSSMASYLWWLGRGAYGLGLLVLLVGALLRPRRGTTIDFLPGHLELPRFGSTTRRVRISYSDVIGVHPWSIFRIPAVVLGARGRSPHFLRARAFDSADAASTFVALVRAGVSALPDGESRIRLLDRRAAAADAISNGRWWMTLGLLALIAVVFLLELRLEAFENIELLTALGANYRSIADPGELYRLVTANLLHVNGLHFGVNALCLLVLGRIFEPLLGVTRFLIVLIVSALAGSVASAWSHPIAASLGASTLGFGLAGCWGYLAIVFCNDLPANFYKTPWVWALIVVLIVVPEVLTPRLDHAAHAASFAAGILATAIVTRGAPLAELAHTPSRSVRAAAIVLGAIVAAGLAVGVLRAWTALAP